jgi:hypothetical protein
MGVAHSLASAGETRMVAGWLLVIVLMWSAIAKMRDLTGTADAIAAFHIGFGPTRRLALALSLTEAGLAIFLASGLVAASLTRFAAGAVAFLFAFFVAILLRAVARGDDFSCHCFGSRSRPINAVTVARAATLTALAVLLAFAGGAHMPATTRLETLVAAVGVLGCVVVASLAAQMLHFNSHLRAIGGR